MENINGQDEGDGQSKEDQGDMSFCMSNYARETMKMMQMMRSHHMLTDVVLEVQSELFHAHKLVLSAASPYFKAMFTGGLKESEMSRVKLQGVSSKTGFLILNRTTDYYVLLIVHIINYYRYVQPQWVAFCILCTLAIFVLRSSPFVPCCRRQQCFKCQT